MPSPSVEAQLKRAEQKARREARRMVLHTPNPKEGEFVRDVRGHVYFGGKQGRIERFTYRLTEARALQKAKTNTGLQGSED